MLGIQNLSYIKTLEKGMSRDSALIIRHGDRQKRVGPDDKHLRLTSLGVERSVQLGKSLSAGPKPALYASPRLRCIETGSRIAEGLGREIDIIESNMLGEHGPFVLNNEIAGESFSNLGTEQVVRGQIRGQGYPGLRSLEEGSRNLLRYACDVVRDSGPAVMISHDAILMPFISFFTGYDFQGEVSWLNPLDGVVVEFKDGFAELAFGKFRKSIRL